MHNICNSFKAKILDFNKNFKYNVTFKITQSISRQLLKHSHIFKTKIIISVSKKPVLRKR